MALSSARAAAPRDARPPVRPGPRPRSGRGLLWSALGVALGWSAPGCEALSAGEKAEHAGGAGVDTGDRGSWEAGFLQLSDGTRCVVDDTSFGFCGESSTAFWGDSSTELAEAACPVELRATVWMHPETGPAGEAHTLGSAAAQGPGEASVWFEVDGAAMISASGTAQAVREAPDRFAITFEVAELLDFLSEEPVGLGAAGRVLCQP